MNQLVVALALVTISLGAFAAKPDLEKTLPGRYIGKVPGNGAVCHVEMSLARGTFFRQQWLTVKARDAENEMTHVVKLSKLGAKLNDYQGYNSTSDDIEQGFALGQHSRDSLEITYYDGVLRQVYLAHTDINFFLVNGGYQVHCANLQRVD
jgi:hypothetical protein